MRTPEGSGSRDLVLSSVEAAANKPVLFVRYRVPSVCTPIPNTPPLASPDTATTNSITPVTINVTTNDYNFNVTGLTVSLSNATSKRGGSLAVSGSSIIYTPPTSPVYNGIDTFTYIVCSGSFCDSARVFVNVTNAPPQARPDIYTMESNTNSTPNSGTFTVLTNDYDPEGSSLSNPIITRFPSYGEVLVSGNSLVYTPDFNFIGTDTLIYQVTELTGNGCVPLTDTALVIINVTNRAPVVVGESNNYKPLRNNSYSKS